MAGSVWDLCDGHASYGRTAMHKTKHADFQQVTRSRRSTGCIVTHQALCEINLSLLRLLLLTNKGIRLVGVIVSNFETAMSAVALPLFEDLNVLPVDVGQRQAADRLE